MAYWTTGDLITADKLNNTDIFHKISGSMDLSTSEITLSITPEEVQSIFDNGQIPVVMIKVGSEGEYVYFNDILLSYDMLNNKLGSSTGEGQFYEYITDHYVLTTEK